LLDDGRNDKGNKPKVIPSGDSWFWRTGGTGEAVVGHRFRPVVGDFQVAVRGPSRTGWKR